jgi:Protein of unknown function (DUF2934)
MLHSGAKSSPPHIHRPAVRMEEVKRAPRVATCEEIARLAHSYWLAGGQREGTALSDWLQAERILNGK